MRSMILVAASLLCFSLAGFAQGQTMPGSEKQAGKQTTVTGCLQKGDESNEFMLTAEDGTKYELKGSNLSAHVGHTVTVTGTPMEEKGAKEAAEGPHLSVSKVQMVSTSCK
jgi:hypothetical protein